MTDQHPIDLLPAYALDCLDEDDETRLAEHLAVCETCRNELVSYQNVVEALPLAMAEFEPPKDLRQRILERARQAHSPSPARTRAGFFTWLRTVPAWTALSLALILALGASNLFLWGRLSALESRSQNQLLTVLLQGTQDAPDATGLLVISLDGTHGTLVVDRLPVLDETHQYQLWLIRDGERTSGGIFSVDERGYKSLYVKSPELLVTYTAFGVTMEPAGGSPGPTGERVLGGDL